MASGVSSADPLAKFTVRLTAGALADEAAPGAIGLLDATCVCDADPGFAAAWGGGGCVLSAGAARRMPRVPPVTRLPLGFRELMICDADGLLCAKAGKLPRTSGATIIEVISARTSSLLPGPVRRLIARP